MVPNLFRAEVTRAENRLPHSAPSKNRRLSCQRENAREYKADEVIAGVFGLIIRKYGLTVKDTKYKSARRFKSEYFVDEQALESLMKKKHQQEENLDGIQKSKAGIDIRQVRKS